MEPTELRLDVFGRRMAVARRGDQWQVYLLSAEGKRRPAEISIPAALSAAEVPGYLADLLHEIATPRNSEVRLLP
ncbi:hypothetical protein ACFFGH_34125 [Lysobacter korlensis]|uniref:DUF7661 domain-containing protein n=1 Tax=Lysobacter korlensis TaxID=553636 RepID=A0ABV6S0Z7_9GAMM